MTTFQQALHIFRKDARHLRWEISGVFLLLFFLILTGVQTWEGLQRRGGPDISNESPLSVLLVVAWSLLIARAIQTEALPGDRHFWLTRPYSRAGLALSKALHQEVHLLEVAFRNRLHEGLKFHFRVEAWFDLPWLSLREQGEVSTVKRRLLHDGAPLEPDRVVAELDFGFWTSLLNRSYDQIIWNQRGLLHRAFPYMPRRWQQRRFLSSQLNPLRRLRNRISHHEPIWRAADLLQRHKELRSMLHWLAPRVLSQLIVPHLFEDVHAHGPELYESEVDG